MLHDRMYSSRSRMFFMKLSESETIVYYLSYYIRLCLVSKSPRNFLNVRRSPRQFVYIYKILLNTEVQGMMFTALHLPPSLVYENFLVAALYHWQTYNYKYRPSRNTVVPIGTLLVE